MQLIPEIENPDKVFNIVEKIIDFNKQQNGKRLKILTHEQILQRLLIVLAQAKACNTYQNVLNKICHGIIQNQLCIYEF